MTLPNATLFPEALLPLYIFEPRYRRMLADVLDSNRMFAVAMAKPGVARTTPLPVAGLGVVRVALDHRDKTSHLILQGIARVILGAAVRHRPYRIHEVRVLPTPPCDSVAADALLARVRELVVERFDLGLPFLLTGAAQAAATGDESTSISPKEVVGYLNSIGNPERAADLVTCTVLPGARERQAILEAVDVETRLRRLIRFLMREIRTHRKGK